MTAGHLSSVVTSVQLDTVTDSKISNINLYSSRAEISRIYKFAVAQGVNQLIIRNLPDVLENETLRVEGKGAGTIHDVSVAYAPAISPPTTSDDLTTLLTQKEEHERAIKRCRKCLAGLESYLNSMDVNHVETSNLTDVVDNYEAVAGRLDSRLLSLEKDLQNVNAEIDSERRRLQDIGKGNTKLRKVATIGFMAEESGTVQMQLTYVVKNATWHATYEIRASTFTKEAPVQLAYKAAIIQKTGESWNDVPLILETTTPSFGINVPTLSSWKLSIFKPSESRVKRYRDRDEDRDKDRETHRAKKRSRLSAARFLDIEAEVSEDEEEEDMRFEDRPAVKHALANLQSKGDLSVAYRVPGLITVPSDGEMHNVTIRNLDLPASLSWVSVPKKDTRAHLTARITNNSEYTFIPGKANVYVDGSFISTISLSTIGSNEPFTCPLGLDQSIRVTYHPSVSKTFETGFYTKTTNTNVSQRITIHNSKDINVQEVTIMDHIPVSDDTQVSVVLKSPRLALPNAEDDPGAPSTIAPSVEVRTGVVASWQDSGESDDGHSLGKDGKLKWVCSIPAKSKLNLLLQWEVSAPTQAVVVNLHA